MHIDELNRMETLLDEIVTPLREDDARWIKNTILRARGDTDLVETIIEMMVAMGYTDGIIKETAERIRAFQTTSDESL